MPAGVYVKPLSGELKTEIPELLLSPCHLKMMSKNKALEEGIDEHESHRNNERKKVVWRTSTGAVANLSTQDEFITALSRELSYTGTENEETIGQSDNKKGLQCLLHTWLLAQLDAVTSNAGSEVNTLVLSAETLLHFNLYNLYGYKSRPYEDVHASSNGSLENKNKTSESHLQILFILTVSEEALDARKVFAYQLTLDERERQNDDFEGSNRLFCKLHFGDPISISSVKDEICVQSLCSNLSSLSWMGSTASEIITSRYFLLKFLCIAIYKHLTRDLNELHVIARWLNF